MNGAGTALSSFSRVGLWSDGKGFVAVAKTGKETAGPMAGAERQVMGATQAGDDLVWIETPSTDLAFLDWSLRTAKSDGSKTRELAHSQILKGDARPLTVTGGTYPVVIGEWVYWAASVAITADPDPGTAEDWEFNILRTKLSEKSKVETVARNAVMPAVAGRDLVYAARQSETSDSYEIHRMAVSGDGSDEILIRGTVSGTSDIVDLAASESYVAWGVRSPEVGEEGWSRKSLPGQIFAMDLATEEVSTVVTADEVGSANLSLTKTGVLWGNGSGNGDPTEYYLNMPTHKLFSLAKNQGHSAVAGDPAHDTVMWAKGTDAKTHRSLWHVAELETSS
ncbi:hypothetical protein Kisp02_14660 [Kineosporia sp. NBRC 101731]|nr:hypothetical protein Kisp02_14660 [Kineosporia sp. NBRC 101731]